MNLLRFRLRNLEVYHSIDYSYVFSLLLITVTVVLYYVDALFPPVFPRYF
jgi:hypothetical protein